MYNPVKFIKDVIDILKVGGPGEAVAAMEITEKNREQIATDLGADSRNYALPGDFVVEFERTITIVPQKDFKKHFAFIADPEPNVMKTVRTIKPI